MDPWMHAGIALRVPVPPKAIPGAEDDRLRSLNISKERFEIASRDAAVALDGNREDDQGGEHGLGPEEVGDPCTARAGVAGAVDVGPRVGVEADDLRRG